MGNSFQVDQYTTVHKVTIRNENTQQTQDTESPHLYDAMDVLRLNTYDTQEYITVLFATLTTILNCTLKEMVHRLDLQNLNQNWIYKISSCHVVQIRDKTKEKLIFCDPTDIHEPLKPLQSKLKRFFSEFHKNPGDLFISDPRASVTTSAIAHFFSRTTYF